MLVEIIAALYNKKGSRVKLFPLILIISIAF